METRQKPQWSTVREFIMNWLKENAISLVIAAVTLVSTFSFYGYRIDALEKHAEVTDQQVATLISGSVSTQVSLAQIQTKLEYISVQLNKLTP